MAKKRRPPTTDAHTALMAGDTAGATPDAAITRRPPPAPPAPPRPPGRDAGQVWQERLTRADRVYKDWADRFECKRLDDYYEGRQWRGVEEAAAKKYTLNLVFATVETQLPSLLFTKPKVQVEARPGHQWTATTRAGARATLIEQTLQTFIDDPGVRFGTATDLALRDAYPRFAVIEVGYSADWIDNPNADKPILREDGAPMFDVGDDGVATPLLPPKKVLKPGTRESLYVRRIDPGAFRASPGRNDLLENDWVAYYEWLPVEDLKRNPEYVHTDQLGRGYPLKADPEVDDTRADDDDPTWRAGQVKVWKIWDLRANERLTYAETYPELLQRRAFTVCPLAVLKFYERRNAFYPLPPIYNWLSPQDAINEDRQMQRVHRRRATRRYMAEPQVDATELEKLETQEDMVTIRVPKASPPPIVPIQDAPLDLQNWTDLAASREDFNQLSGVSGEARNTPSAPTATQANIMNVRAQIRESRARQQVADWLAEIARLILLTLRERMKLPFWIKQSVDPFTMAADPQRVADVVESWLEITAEDVSDLNVDVGIDVASLSPVAEDAQRNQWNVVLSLFTNPALNGWFFTPVPGAPNEPSPLLRKTLTLNGITSDQEIREIDRLGKFQLQQGAEAAKAQAALAKQPDPPKVSVTMKAEDILLVLGPIEGKAYVRALLGGEAGAGTVQAAHIAQPMPPALSPDAGGGMSLPAPGGIPTGVPATAPSGGP